MIAAIHHCDSAEVSVFSIDEAGAVAGAMVRAIDADGIQHQSGRTDHNGKVVLELPRRQSWKIVVDAEFLGRGQATTNWLLFPSGPAHVLAWLPRMGEEAAE